MKFKTFRNLMLGGVVSVLSLFGFCVSKPSSLQGSNNEPARTVSATPASTPVAVKMDRFLAKAKIETLMRAWLTSNADRGTRQAINDVFPQEPYRVKVLRFPDKDAVKWASQNSMWSQIRIDYERDNVDDEKWLLKEGQLYKREVLDTSGKVTETSYFGKFLTPK